MIDQTVQEFQNSIAHLQVAIERFVPLADKNWFKTGGVARYFSAPSSRQQFQQALSFAQEYHQPIFILGRGANILINDAGFAGLIIRPQLTEIEEVSRDDQHVYVRAGSGVVLENLIQYCLDHNILGLEEFSGIPSTVGGAVYINLHYYQFLLEHFLVEAEVICAKTGVFQTVSKEWFNFGYNKSRLQQNHDYLLVSAVFALKPCTDLDAAYARGRSAEIIRHRNSRYPSSGTCGSFFRNFYEHEVTLESNGKKMIYIAYYLDKLGVKGSLSVGGATVSYQHANMIVNSGTATSQDIIDLARAMQQKVYDNFGIVPRPECLLVGFDSNPLLQK